jgi:hypothetical protein
MRKNIIRLVLFNRGEILTKLGHRVVYISLSKLKNASNEHFMTLHSTGMLQMLN